MATKEIMPHGTTINYRMKVAYSFHAILYSMPYIKKLDKHIIAITKAI
jgi:hypothetical protein